MGEMLAERLQLGDQLCQSRRRIRREIHIHKKHVFPQLPFGWARFNSTHVQPPLSQTSQRLKQGPRRIAMQRERQAGHISMLTALPTTQQEKTGAITRNIDRSIKRAIEKESEQPFEFDTKPVVRYTVSKVVENKLLERLQAENFQACSPSKAKRTNDLDF